MTKKIMTIMLSIALVCSLAACSNTQQGEQEGSTPDTSLPPVSEPEEANGGEDISELETELPDTNESSALEETETNILIAYFTYGENAELPSDVDASTTASIQLLNDEVTGNTGVMAHMIAEASGGDLFSIRTVEPYPDNYDDTIEVGQAEKNNGTRPELSTQIENLEQYDTIFVGFPNWWYGMPMVMYSFFDEYDFGGKTIIPFCTSGGSAFSDAIEEIKGAEPSATVLDGLHIGGSSVSGAESRVIEWIAELGFSKQGGYDRS